ncbi:putative transporter [Suttonella sp. R2A3]|uniref:putative transporter n=1 Tax=Suttonella sp. R2A3 TaxID=2908648 RepID=UPI001F3C4D3D|nr:putative transporter [Suttonella sp. R2A3]UJF25287.1 putative transporter [Suttonella sp. R2A3]
MFRSFFLNKKWWVWSIGGTLLIALTTWYKVEIDVKINEWFGEFYNAVQDMLSEPGSVTFETFLGYLWTFGKLAGVYILIVVLVEFFARHYIFRWRTAMNEYYTENWQKLRHIEGASQRIQEDTMRFARIMEGLGLSLLRALMTLFAFLPLLWVLSENITELPWIGNVPHALVWVVLITTAMGTALLMLAGIRLPGLEFNNQMVEAAYRKELVYGEDHIERADLPTLNMLYADVRHNYFRLYINYLYFDLVKWTYLQASVLFPYLALGPTLITGAITLGLMQQVVRAFSKVEASFQFLVHSWSTIVELISIHKRLKAFEQQMHA